MSRKTLVAIAAFVVLASAAEAGWVHFTSSLYQAEEEIQKHPGSLVRVLVMPRKAVEPMICASYVNTVGQKNRGRVVVDVAIERADGTVDSLKLAGGVKDNAYLRCKPTETLKVGDIVTFEFDFRRMPRLRIVDEVAEYLEADGLVSTVGEPELEALGLGPAEEGGWLHSVNSVFQAEEDNQKHPKSLAQTLVMPREGAEPLVCSAYTNVAGDQNKGRVVTRVTILREDGSSEKLKFAGGVRQNEYLKCKPVDDLAPGDMVEFDFELKGMPRLAMADEAVDFADVNGVVSTAGEPAFRTPPPEEPPPAVEPVAAPDPPAPTDPPPSSPPPPPAPSGSISEADQRAVSRLLLQSKPTQLQRPKANSPGKWVVVGPKTTTLPDSRKLDYRTAGVGGTIAAAVADYERKMNDGLGSGSLLSTADRQLIEWYSGMSPAGGSTAVRRDSQGRYHGEYYRPSTGTQHNGPLGSMAAAIDWLKRQGL